MQRGRKRLTVRNDAEIDLVIVAAVVQSPVEPPVFVLHSAPSMPSQFPAGSTATFTVRVNGDAPAGSGTAELVVLGKAASTADATERNLDTSIVVLQRFQLVVNPPQQQPQQQVDLYEEVKRLARRIEQLESQCLDYQRRIKQLEQPKQFVRPVPEYDDDDDDDDDDQHDRTIDILELSPLSKPGSAPRVAEWTTQLSRPFSPTLERMSINNDMSLL